MLCTPPMRFDNLFFVVYLFNEARLEEFAF